MKHVFFNYVNSAQVKYLCWNLNHNMYRQIISMSARSNVFVHTDSDSNWFEIFLNNSHSSLLPRSSLTIMYTTIIYNQEYFLNDSSLGTREY